MPLDTAGDVAALRRVLDDIAEEEVRAGRLILVVHGTRNMPRVGLFKLAKKKKLQKTDDLTFFAKELGRVHTFLARYLASGCQA